MTRLLLVLTIVLGLLPAQGRDDAFVECVLRGDLAGARAIAADSARSLPERALLLASLAPPHERVVAMTAIASMSLRDAVGLRALRAAASALLVVESRDHLLPADAARFTVPIAGGDSDDPTPPFAVLLQQLRQLCAARRANARDDDVAALDEIDAWLEWAAVGSFDDVRHRIRVGDALRLEQPLAETIDARRYAFPIDRGIEDFTTLADPEPVSVRLAAGTSGASLTAPPGSWLIELRSERARALGLLVVSDLELATTVVGAQVSVLATFTSGDRRESAAGLRLRLGWLVNAATDAAAAPTFVWHEATTDADGRLETLAPATARRLIVTADSPRGPARCETIVDVRPPTRQSTRTAHLMVDRPVYRDGERVHGRVLVRHVVVGEPTGATVTAAAGERLRIRCVAADGNDETPAVDFELDVTTDDAGIATFAVDLGADAKPGERRIRVHADAGDAPVLDVGAFVVDAYRRPPVLVALTLARTTSPTDAVTATLTARFANGAPAASLPIRWSTESWPWLAGTGTTDADGMAHFVVDAANRGNRALSISAKIVAPDGQTLRVARSLAAQRTDESAQTGWADARTGLSSDAAPRIGVPWTIRVETRATVSELLTIVGAGGVLATIPLRADGTGSCTSTMTPDMRWWPQVTVHRSHGGQPWDSDTESAVESWVAVAAERIQLRTTVPESALPTKPVEITFECVDDEGRGVVADLSVTVVDERVYQTHGDRTRPADTLAPRVLPPSIAGTASLPHLIGRRLVSKLERMLDDGRVRRPEYWIGMRRGGPSTPGPGGPSTPGHRGGDGMRENFRATANFVGRIRTDANGRAKLAFVLPDTVTRYRVTCVAVVADGVASAMATTTFDAALPIATDLVLPRMLRVGDRLTSTAVVAVAEGKGPAATPNVAIEATGVTATLGPVHADATGTAFHAELRLAATTPGDATLTTTATHGTDVDRARVPLIVADDRHELTLAAVAVIGAATLSVDRSPVGERTPSRRTLKVAANANVIADDIAASLRAYPYGCVEQTCSRLAGWLATRRAALLRRAPAAAAPAVNTIATTPLIARLRSMATRDGSAWWPGGEIDPEATVVYLRGLRMLKDAGFDLVAEDVVIPAAPKPSTKLTRRIDIETAIARLRLDPTDAALATAIRDATRSPRPRGVLARAARAFLDTGDRATAIALAERIATGQGAVDDRPRLFFGDDDVTVAAEILELAIDLAPERGDEAVAAARSNLLRAVGATGASLPTYSRAATVLALRREVAAAADTDRVVTIRVGDHEMRLSIGATTGGRLEHDLAQSDLTAPVRVDAGNGTPCLATLIETFDERASTAPAHANGITVRRWWQREGVVDRAVAGDAPTRGRTGTLVVAVEARTDLRYVVVHCPLPAGFELVHTFVGVDRFDDGIVFAIDRLAAGRPAVLHIPVVAGFEGDFVWPPTTAFAMYDESRRGSTAGTKVRVRATTPAPAPAATAAALPEPEPPNLASPRKPPSPPSPPEDDESELQRRREAQRVQTWQRFLRDATVTAFVDRWRIEQLLARDPPGIGERFETEILPVLAEWLTDTHEGGSPSDWHASIAYAVVARMAPAGRRTTDAQRTECVLSYARHLDATDAIDALARIAPAATADDWEWIDLERIAPWLDEIEANGDGTTADFVRALVVAYRARAEHGSFGSFARLGELGAARLSVASDLLLEIALDVDARNGSIAYELLPDTLRNLLPLERRLALAADGQPFATVVAEATAGGGTGIEQAWREVCERFGGDVTALDDLDDIVDGATFDAILTQATDAQLASMHGSTQHPDLRELVFDAAVARRLPRLAPAPGDPLGDRVDALLAARSGDREASQRFREQLLADHADGTRGDLSTDDFRRVVRAAVAAMNVDELIRFGATFLDEDWLAAAYARRPPAERVARLRHALRELGTRDDAIAALWSVDASTLREVADAAAEAATQASQSARRAAFDAFARVGLTAAIEDAWRVVAGPSALVAVEPARGDDRLATLLDRVKANGMKSLSASDRATLASAARVHGWDVGH